MNNTKTKTTTTNRKRNTKRATADRTAYQFYQAGIKQELAQAMSKGEKFTDFLNRLTAYDYATLCVSKALRNLYTMSGQQLFLDLENQCKNDETASKGGEYAEQLSKHQKAHAEHIKAVEEYTLIINALKTTAEERATANQWKKHHQAQARQEQTAIDDLTALLQATHSDREQLVQEAVIQVFENTKNPAPITAKILETYGAETEEELTEEERAEAQTRANYKKVLATIKREVRQLANPDALNSSRTKVKQITAEQAHQWRATYGADENAREMTKSGYITIEHRNTAKYKGWYKVHHYKTIAPYQYIEHYTETDEGETDIAYIKTYNPFISSSADLDRIEELSTRADLTERERLFLEHFARRCRFSADFKDCKQYAFKQIGIETATNQSTFFNRLKNKLKTQ